MEGGNYIVSSPLVLCNGEDFSCLDRFIKVEAAVQLGAILKHTFDSIEQVIMYTAHNDDRFAKTCTSSYVGPDLDELAEPLNPPCNTTALLVQTCALASRIYFRSLKNLDGTVIDANSRDAVEIYHNLRFLGLKSFAGLPYVYLWL
ncbi:hypothetical protein FOMA001_g13360 [Fusarium oxysporum f. sp. matthiolae]|jgi:hypothetical protein|nr:hypothetical protein FOMA001_g13360 [Fusarium oxysporum f. sp. matthiolae]